MTTTAMTPESTVRREWEHLIRQRLGLDSKPNPLMVPLHEVAQVMGYSTASIRRMCRDGEIPGAMQYRERGQWMVPWGSLVELVTRA